MLTITNKLLYAIIFHLKLLYAIVIKNLLNDVL